MRLSYRTISARDVAAWAVETLITVLPAHQPPPPSAPPRLILQVLVRAAAAMRSLAAVVRQATQVPSLETIRSALRTLLPPVPEDLVPALQTALHHRLPKSLSRRPRALAIDLHLRPYYGRRGTPGSYRGKAKAGTKTFFAYATVMVLRRGASYTVGVVPVVNGQELTVVLDSLLAQAAAVGLVPRLLLLDRGFYAATTIAWLQQRGLRFVMPMIRRGRSQGDDGGTGTTPFFGRTRQGWDSYTWTARPRRDGRKQKALTVTVAVCMAARAGQAPWVFVCDGLKERSPAMIATLYRRRFRIETCYRQLGQGLAATCTRDGVYRLLLVGIALVLRNLWLWLHATFLSGWEEGRYQAHPALMRLRQMAEWLIAALDEVLGHRTEIVVPNLEAILT
jgi:Transposase DDE domain